MNKIKVLILILFTSFTIAQTYQIDWYVIGSGGGTAESDNYQIGGTIGQPVVGVISSENYIIESGFWVGSGITSSSYQYLPGDANMAAETWPAQTIGGDVTYLVNYFRGLADACYLDGFYASADATGDCLVVGGDVTYLVNYFRGLADMSYCSNYEPAWPTPSDVPAEAPDGWPNCD